MPSRIKYFCACLATCCQVAAISAHLAEKEEEEEGEEEAKEEEEEET